MQPAVHAGSVIVVTSPVVVVIKLVRLNRREEREGGEEGKGRDKLRSGASENYDAVEIHCLNTISRATANDLFYMSFAAQSIAHRRLRIMSLCSNINGIFSTVAQFLPHFYIDAKCPSYR